MAIGCGAKCAKIILIIYDIIFLLSGLFLIACGIWLLVDGTIGNIVSLTFNGSNSHLLRNSAILLIAMGCLIVVVSIIGLVGAIMENTILLGIYIGFLIVVFCGEIAGGVLAIVFKDQIIDNISTILSNTLTNALNQTTSSRYYNERNTTANPINNTCYTSDIGYLWDFAQFTWNCCGVDGTSDYDAYHLKTMCPLLSSDRYPISCYPPSTSSYSWGQFYKNSTTSNNQYVVQNNFNITTPFNIGCQDSITFWVERYAPVLIGIGIGFAMLEMFGIIFAVCLCRNVGHDID